MKDILLRLSKGESLSEETAAQAMHAMMDGTATPAQISAYLTLLCTRGETIAELTGSARAMRDHALALPLQTRERLVDTCGTGGDHAGTFNISTAAAFVAAAGGVQVAKHGNRAASSQTGSADVLTALGVAITLTPEQAAQCLRDTGFCFLFAQAYHPAMKYVAPIRKELGYRTMFNVLGPLTNPARPDRQVLGTPSASIAEKMAYVLASLGCTHALVVHAKDGLDEISIAAPTHVFEVRQDIVHSYEIDPSTFGLPYGTLADVQGGDAEANAALIHNIFAGEHGPRRDIVVMNAAASLYVAGAVSTLADGARRAEQLLDDGLVLRKLQEVVACSRAYQGGVTA